MAKRTNVKEVKAKIETVKDQVTPEEMIENARIWMEERKSLKLREFLLKERRGRVREAIKALAEQKKEVEDRYPFDPPTEKNPLFTKLDSLGSFTFSFDLDDPEEAAREFAEDIIFRFPDREKAEQWFTNFIFFMKNDVKFGKFDKI